MYTNLYFELVVVVGKYKNKKEKLRFSDFQMGKFSVVENNLPVKSLSEAISSSRFILLVKLLPICCSRNFNHFPLHVPGLIFL